MKACLAYSFVESSNPKVERETGPDSTDSPANPTRFRWGIEGDHRNAVAEIVRNVPWPEETGAPLSAMGRISPTTSL